MKKLLYILSGFVLASLLANQTPEELWGSVYNLTLPTYQTGQTAIWQGDVNGKIRLNGLVITPCGTGVIDLTTGCPQPMLGVF